MTMIINKWVFPIVATALLSLFYISDQSSISPVGLVLTTILTFIGIAITERLDKIIEQKEKNG